MLRPNLKPIVSITMRNFTPIQVNPAKAGTNSERVIAEQLGGAWLQFQRSSVLQ